MIELIQFGSIELFELFNKSVHPAT